MKVAIIHDWLVTYAGAERVLEHILALYPDADLYGLVEFLPSEERAFLGGRQVHTSFLQKLPGARKRYRSFLPLMPLAIEQFDLTPYDLVVSSSYAVAKGVLTGADQLHVCYCHSPMRYAWDLQHQYLREAGLDQGVRSWLARYVLHRMRGWDQRTANGVDHFIANSHFVAARIRKFYRREATVIYPPVDIEIFTPGGVKQDYYVTASRLVPYKRVDLIVEAFSRMPNRRLVIIGDGPEIGRIASKAGTNIKLLGRQPLAVLREHLQQARAFVFSAEEDFGIAPVEALACGTPVIAYGKGGVLESVRGPEHVAPTGVFFYQQTVAAIQEAADHFEREESRFSPVACRERALHFAPEIFRKRLKEHLDGAIERFRGREHRHPGLDD